MCIGIGLTSKAELEKPVNANMYSQRILRNAEVHIH
jgi:hypothetical protein